jgi:hypothetical protein
MKAMLSDLKMIVDPPQTVKAMLSDLKMIVDPPQTVKVSFESRMNFKIFFANRKTVKTVFATLADKIYPKSWFLETVDLKEIIRSV